MTTNRDGTPNAAGTTGKRGEAGTFSFESKNDPAPRAQPAGKQPATPGETSESFTIPAFLRRGAAAPERRANADLTWKDEDFARIAATAETQRQPAPEKNAPAARPDKAAAPRTSDREASPETKTAPVTPRAPAPADARAETPKDRQAAFAGEAKETAPLVATPVAEPAPAFASAKPADTQEARPDEIAPTREPTVSTAVAPGPALAPRDMSRLRAEAGAPDLMARLAARVEPIVTPAFKRDGGESDGEASPAFGAPTEPFAPRAPMERERVEPTAARIEPPLGNPQAEAGPAFHVNRAYRDDTGADFGDFAASPRGRSRSTPADELFVRREHRAAPASLDDERREPVGAAWRDDGEPERSGRPYEAPRFGPAINTRDFEDRKGRPGYEEPVYLQREEKRGSPVRWLLAVLLLAGGGYALAHQMNFKMPDLPFSRTAQVAEVVPAPAPAIPPAPATSEAAPTTSEAPATPPAAATDQQQAAVQPAPPTATQIPAKAEAPVAAAPKPAEQPEAIESINVAKAPVTVPKAEETAPVRRTATNERDARASERRRAATQEEAMPRVVELAPGPQMLTAPPSAARANADGTISNELVLDTQRELNRLGYPDVPYDGQLDLRTRRAVRAFQLETGLAPTGNVDMHTLETLRRTSQMGMRFVKGPNSVN